MVFHFFQDANGNGNFSDVPQGFANHEGYELAESIVNIINAVSNPTMVLPPNNQTPSCPRNIDFIVDHVFFHQDQAHFLYPGVGGTSSYNAYGHDVNNTIQVLVKGQTNNPTGPNGNASNVDLASTVKWVQMNGQFDRYMAAANSQEYNNWFSVLFHSTGHELFHTLGLSHTVRHNDGQLCNPNNPNDCNDFCDDTPTPFELFTNFAFTEHPGCPFGFTLDHCSNNWMDYSGVRSLTPQQINRMHFGLENVLSTFTVCDALENDRFLCDLGYPMVRAFGRQVIIGNCGNDIPTLEPENINTIYFTRQVEFEEVEIGNGAWFEVTPSTFACF